MSNTPNDLVPEEREAFKRLRQQFGDKFKFRITNGHVTFLDMSHRGLTSVPPELGNFPALTELQLIGNQLTSVPPELGNLPALTTLRLDYNQLTAVPLEIGRLQALTILYLNANQLTSVPPELGQLTALTTLYLSYNQLAAVPAELGQLTALTKLSLASNHLGSVPAEIGRLTALTELYLYENHLGSVPPELGRLTALTKLYLYENHLGSVPPELGRLTALTQLWLDGNQLTSVPPELGNLLALTQLRLSYNQLTSVPAELGQLTALTELDLNGNPLPDPYPELQERGISAVLAYLSSLIDKTQVKTLREARLILVGNGKVGKTQLKNALLGLPFEEQAATTHGVEIDRTKQLPLHCETGDDLTLTIWDFGGQETYEVTHQFFYGKRSIYLLVWHPRTLQEAGVDAWLRKLKLRLGDDARVIIVATHKATDKRPADPDLIGLKQKFGDMVIDFYQVENDWKKHPDNGISELKGAIAAAANKLSVMGMKVNKDWLAVRDDITALAESTTHIPRSQFVEIAGRHGLPPDVAAVWLNLLHDLGDLLYYGDVEGLKDTVVLRPDWLTGGIARVLDDAKVLEDHGVLDHVRLPELWVEYDRALHPFLHSVMEKFDICCREHEGQKWSLVGEKVPHPRPVDIPPPEGNQLHLVYEFEDEPTGLVPWLIVRNFRFTANKHWRLGAYLRYDGHGARSGVSFGFLSERWLARIMGHETTSIRSGVVRRRAPGTPRRPS